MADSGNRTAAWLLAIVLFLIVYGSLFPFSFDWSRAADALEALPHLGFARTTRGDIAANLLLYFPAGLLLAWLLAPRLGALAAIIVTTLFGLVLSLGIELLQFFEPRRVASLTDMLLNVAGMLAGALAALVGAQGRSRLRSGWLAVALREPIAIALIVCWLLVRLLPLAPTLDVQKWRAALEPLGTAPWWIPLESARLFVAWTVVGYAASAAGRRRLDWAWLFVIAAIATLGRIVIIGKVLLPVELAAMAASIPAALILARVGTAGASILAWAIAALAIVRGLEPFTFALDTRDIRLAPFGTGFAGSSEMALPVLLDKVFFSAALVWLLTRAGHAVLWATLLAAGLLLGIEVLQVWLPSRTPNVTDPLLAVVAGGVIALLQGAGQGSAPAPAAPRRAARG
jgi:VanZ family protein